MEAINIQLKGLRLDLIDLVSPYGIMGRELIPFDDELSAIVGLAPEMQRKSLEELANKIKVYYKKLERVK